MALEPNLKRIPPAGRPVLPEPKPRLDVWLVLALRLCIMARIALADYMAIKRAIREDCQRKLEALELTWSVAKQIKPQPRLPGVVPEEDSSTAPTESVDTEAPTPNGSGDKDQAFSLAKEVRRVIAEFGNATFTQGQVTERVQNRYPGEMVYPASVSGTLARLVKQGELKLLRRARGGAEPSLYRRAE